MLSEKLHSIQKLIDEIEKLKPISDENKRKLDKKFRLEFNYNSNHLEGNTLTYSETELLLIYDDTKGNHPFREYEEMKAHDVAFGLIHEVANDEERPLTETFIKNLNEILLVRPYWKNAITPDGQNTRRQIKVGDYKEFPNSVRLQNGELFEYASPQETPILMAELIDWYKKEVDKKDLHPVILAALLHYKFVRIHPFDDGNGRISRLLMNYVLLKNQFPPIIIKSAEKNDYLKALNRADVGDIEAFTEYIAEQLIWSLELTLKAHKGEALEEDGDFDKRVSVLNKGLKNQKQFLRLDENVINNVKFNVFDKVKSLSFLKFCKIENNFESIKLVYPKKEDVDYNFTLRFIFEFNNFKYSKEEKSFSLLFRIVFNDVFAIIKASIFEGSFLFHELTIDLNGKDFLNENDFIDKFYYSDINSLDIEKIAEIISGKVLDHIENINKDA